MALRYGIFLTFVLLTCAAPVSQPVAPASQPALIVTAHTVQTGHVTFTNPILPSAPDPFIFRDKGMWYLTSTSHRSIAIRRSATFIGLSTAAPTVIFQAPLRGHNANEVWAPEFHKVGDHWYVYYCADDGVDADHRLFVLRSVTSDPAGAYEDMGRVRGMSEHWAIDPNIINFNNKLYLLWSGWPEAPEAGHRIGGPQTIYIAEMSDPLTVVGKRVAISRPSYSWETHGWPVNEGPEAFQHDGRLFVLFSASGGSTENYCLGLLSLKPDANPLDASLWNKTDHPVFAEYTGPDGRVFGPGHCAVFISPDSHESWLLYHARDAAQTTWMGRSARAQTFTYATDGTPNFGHPLPTTVHLSPPAGDPDENLAVVPTR
jgi:GH43 family beta-xylosidase